jgi:hypothetical protein
MADICGVADEIPLESRQIRWNSAVFPCNSFVFHSVCALVAQPYAPATIIFLISAIALAGFSPFGHTVAQFMIVWQR